MLPCIYNRIRIYEPPDLRIIIPALKVVQPCLVVVEVALIIEGSSERSRPRMATPVCAQGESHAATFELVF